MTNKGDTKTVKTTETVFDVIEAVEQLESCGVTEVANCLNRSKSTIHAHLVTLCERGYLVKEGEKYRLGFRFFTLGGATRKNQYRTLYKMARPEIDELVEETGERAQCTVAEQGKGYFLYQAEGNRAVMADTYIGAQVPLHATAGGKAYLANIPEDRVHEIIDAIGLPEITKHTITERGALLEELASIREQNVAFDRAERIPGIYCVGAPIQTDQDKTLGAVSISIPQKRSGDGYYEENLANLVKSAARLIGLNTTYS